MQWSCNLSYGWALSSTGLLGREVCRSVHRYVIPEYLFLPKLCTVRPGTGAPVACRVHANRLPVVPYPTSCLQLRAAHGGPAHCYLPTRLPPYQAPTQMAAR